MRWVRLVSSDWLSWAFETSRTQPASRQRSGAEGAAAVDDLRRGDSSSEAVGVYVGELRPLGQVQEQVGGGDRVVDVVEFGMLLAGVVQGLGVGDGDRRAELVEFVGDRQGG